MFTHVKCECLNAIGFRQQWMLNYEWETTHTAAVAIAYILKSLRKALKKCKWQVKTADLILSGSLARTCAGCHYFYYQPWVEYVRNLYNANFTVP